MFDRVAGETDVLPRVDAHGHFGFPSVASWLRERRGMLHRRAAERVTVARQLPRLERVRKLLSGRGLSFGFASSICSASSRLDDADAQVAEDILLGMVEDGCTVTQVAKAGERITDLVGERLGREPEPADSKRGFARSWMTRSKSLDGGSWFKGWCDPEHTAAFDQIIGPLARPRARGDDRDLAQRTADALFSVITEGNRGAGVTVIIDLAAYAAATGDPGPFTHAPRAGTDTGTSTGTGTSTSTGTGTGTGTGSEAASSSGAGTDVGSDAEEAREALSSRNEADRARDGDGPGHTGVPGVRGTTSPSTGRRRPARLLDGTPISPGDACRLALNGGVSSLILGRNGIPLYLGRTTRFATSAQRRVLLAQYETCSIVGCRIPAHLCEIHHLDGGWKLGAPTDIDRLAPLCGWHNRWIEGHQDQVAQTRDDRGRIVLKILPPWSTRRTTGPSPRLITGDHRQPGAP
ncbi:DUF222 domain-containing protein [Actinomadura scrupuli]|uniref:DUF222 domain-containing protein n=1 Tax=Actinomadura scrupuli TaxID=559629 RepID=UPI003D98078F